MRAFRVINSKGMCLSNCHHGQQQLCAMNNVFSNQSPFIYHNQKRTKIHNLHSKMLFHPKYKKVYKHPRKMKEYMFTDDTLHSLSHGEDYKVKVRVADYPQLNKRKYKVHPNRFILRLWSDILGVYQWLPVSEKGLHKINQAGSFDRYILTTPPRDMNSRLGEKMRYRLLRVLERKEDEMIEAAMNGDTKALTIAYGVVLQQERDERRALLRRNNWLSQREGRYESRRRNWTRHELQHRIEMIQNGVMPQKQPVGIPLTEEIQKVFDDTRKAKLQKEAGLFE